MKIAHIIQGGRGGTLEYLKLLIPRLEKNGFQNIIVCHGEVLTELRALGMKSFEVNMHREISIKNDLFSVINICKLIKREKPDICYLHSSKAGALGRIACFLSKTDCIYNPHGWSFAMRTTFLKKLMFAIIEKFLSPLCKRIILISNAEFNLAIKWSIAHRDKFIIINNGVDIEKIRDATPVDRNATFNCSNNTVIIGMVGRITQQKDYYTFLKIGFEISKEITDFRLVIVGDGEQKNDILSFIEKSGLKNKVIITGWVNNPECYIKSFDIAVLTSKWEGFGLVVAEYLAAEKPVIASNVDGIPFIIKHGFNGFLAEPGNEYNFSQQIIALIKDKNLVSKIVENGKNTVKNRFSIDRVVSEHLKIFESLINKHNNDFQRVCSTNNKSRDQFISPFTFKS